MQVGAFSVVESYPTSGGAAEPDRYGDLLRLIETAERSGLRSFWVAEHHFQSSGVCPSPPVLLAAAGVRTATIRLGSLVSVLPFHRPVDLAEEYALLDQLLHGRLNFGVGSGYVPAELDGFGVSAEEKGARFDAHLATVLAAFRGEAIVTDGGTPVRLNVRPVQQPHPPVWVAVQRKEALVGVGRQGLSAAMLPYATCRDPDDLAKSIRAYRAALPDEVRGWVTVALPLYAGGDRSRALCALRRHLESRSATQGGFFEGTVRHGPARTTAESVDRSGFALFGPRHEVTDRLAELAALGVDEFLGIFDFGELPRDDVVYSMRAVGNVRVEERARWPVAAPARAVQAV